MSKSTRTRFILILALGFSILLTVMFMVKLLVAPAQEVTQVWAWHTEKPISVVTFSPDGRFVAVGEDYGRIELLQVSDNTPLWTSNLHSKGVSALAISPDGQLLASGGGRSDLDSGNDDQTIRIWKVASGQQQASITDRLSTVRSMSWSPDGQLLASGSDDGTVRLWRVK